MVWVLDDEEGVWSWSVFWKMEKWNREGSAKKLKININATFNPILT